MAGESPAYPSLFSELRVGRKMLRNLIALPATLTNYGVANRITERWTSFLVERARGGAGLIVSEVIAVDPNAIAQGAIVTGFDSPRLRRRFHRRPENAGRRGRYRRRRGGPHHRESGAARPA